MKRKILSLFLCSVMLAGAACGCGVDNNLEPDSTADSVGTTENLSEGFDWEKVKQDITFDGRKIDFPFCVNDLGKGYEMDYIYDSLFEEKCCDGAVVKVNDDGSEEKVCYLFFDGITAEEYTDDTKCSDISHADSLIVQGIGEGSSLDDAEKVFGKPYKSDEVFYFYLSKTGTERIELKYDKETKNVKSVQITLNFKEY